MEPCAGFDCTACACGQAQSGTTIYEVNHAFRLNLPDLIRSDSFKWSFFRPFGDSGELTGTRLPALYNLTGWEPELAGFSPAEPG